MTAAMAADLALEAVDLSVHFPVRGRGFWGRALTLRAVDGVSIAIAHGETLALVGESGCGKTTLGRAFVGLSTPAAGAIRIDGTDVAGLDAAGRRALTRRVQMIFQDPYASLNPRMTVREIIAEPLRAHGVGSRGDRTRRVVELLELVGLPRSAGSRLPAAFSGGQRQRISIARALALRPEVIVADEPVSALDVSIQAQIINLLRELQRELGLTMLFISHDLAIVRHIATRVAVMYLGKIVESGERDLVFGSPQHPYTQALLSAVPSPDPDRPLARARDLLVGDLPSPIAPPAGCRFHTRCPVAFEPCPAIEPALLAAASASGRLTACHLVNPLGISEREART